MAQRPIFIPQTEGDTFVLTKSIDFEWIPGMAFSQKQKSMDSLHKAARKHTGIHNILEVSSKSREPLGVELSAFNLMVAPPDNESPFSVECAFQGSKIFKNGGPYKDILYKSSRDAKRDQRLRDSGHLTGFEHLGEHWPIEPQTAFYDWLYISALRNLHDTVTENLFNYDAFTDIEFNPKKSINCQAYSVALYVALDRRNKLKAAMSSKNAFIKCVKSAYLSNAKQDDRIQGNLF